MISKDKQMKNAVSAVGVWFYSRTTQRHLYLIRNDLKHPACWALAGGKQEAGETLLQTLTRECEEELGAMPCYIKLVPVDQFTSVDMKFCYHTFFCVVENEFHPVLNSEHLGYAWINSGTWPSPLHSGLWSTVNYDTIKDKVEIIKSAVQMSQ